MLNIKRIIKRNRGAPKGNQNALKHGYYSKALNKTEQFDFTQAAGIEGITEEITLLRFEIKKAISSGDIYNLIPLSKAALALEKLIRTHHKIFVARQLGIKDAMEKVFKNLLATFGPDVVQKAAAFTLPDKFTPDTILTNQKTNNIKNEAELTYNKKQ